MADKQKITEEMGLQKEWKEKARDIKTPAELQEFVRHLTEDFDHDYGTIVHAMTAAMIAAYSVLEHSPQGGITGMQASFLAWEMVGVFMGKSEGGRRMLNNNDLLYPQNAYKFTTISQETADWVKAEAAKRIQEGNAHPNVLKHWEALAGGEIPFGLRIETKDEA